MEVYIFRHGLTQLTKEHRYVGTTDPELSPDGIEQAKQLTPALNPPIVFSSPMKRAKDTAKIWFPDAEIIEIDGLKELDFGKFEGHNAEELKDDEEYQLWVDNFGRSNCPGGEGMELFLPRVSLAFREVVGQAKKLGLKDLVIITHGVTTMAIMAGFCKDRRNPAEWYSKTCEAWHTKLIGGQKKPVLIHPQRFNENSADENDFLLADN